MAEAVKIQVEARDPAEEQGDGHPGRAPAAQAGADPGDHLRAQAGRRADHAGARRRLGDDQEVDPPRRARPRAARPRPSWSATSSGTTWARRSSTSTSPASAPRSRSRPRCRLELRGMAPGHRRAAACSSSLVHNLPRHLPRRRDPRLDPGRRQRPAVDEGIHVRDLSAARGRDRRRRPRAAAGPRRHPGRGGRADRGRPRARPRPSPRSSSPSARRRRRNVRPGSPGLARSDRRRSGGSRPTMR